MKQNLKMFPLLAATFILASEVFAATPGTYTFLASPDQAPDAVLNASTNVDSWAVANTGATGSGNTTIGDTPVWSIWCWGGGGGGTITQTHTFAGGALASGQTVSLDYAHNWQIAVSKTIGIKLMGTGGEVVSVVFTGGDSEFKFTDSAAANVSTGQPYNPNVLLPFSFTLTSATTYCATLNGHTWTGTLSAPITGLQIFNGDAGDNSDQYSANLRISAAQAIPDSYAVLADPDANPDAKLNGTTDVNSWIVAKTGATGSFMGTVGGTSAWDIWCNAVGGGGTITQTHAFAGGMLASGQTVSLDYAHNTNIDTGKTVGIKLLSIGGTGVTIAFTGNSPFFKFTDSTNTAVSTGQDYNPNVLMPFSFTLTSDTTYSATLNGHAWTGTLDAPVTGIQVFNNDAGNDSDQYSANLRVTSPSLQISSTQMISGNTEIQFTVIGLVMGSNYKVQDSLTLSGFADVTGSRFTANETSRLITLPANPGSVPKRFFIVTDAP